MTGGVQQDPPEGRLRLSRRRDSSEGEQSCLGGVQVVDAQFEMGLLLLKGVRPGGTPVAASRLKLSPVEPSLPSRMKSSLENRTGRPRTSP